MRKSIELSEEERREIIQKFYAYFETGYKFEDFLKNYLEAIGLEEIVVTKRSGDGGIDLTAVRRGIGGLSNSVDQPYYIQAKRHAPERTAPPKDIRELRGSFASGTGIFITTGKVSENAKMDAKEVDPSRPIIVIDGKELVNSCIEHEIGFVFKPVFSGVALDNIMRNEPRTEADQVFAVERIVTENDIRAYILVVPRAVRDTLPENAAALEIKFGDTAAKKYNLSADRRYVGGIAAIYRNFGLRRSDGIFVPQKAVWTKEASGCFRVDFRLIP